MLVLQIAVQAEALAGEVLADHGHAEVGAVLAAELFREGIAVVARGVGETAGLVQQQFPLLVGQTTALPVGARVLSPVVEEADVVVLLLERFDLALDEVVQLEEVVGQVLGNLEVHARNLCACRCPGIWCPVGHLDARASTDSWPSANRTNRVILA